MRPQHPSRILAATIAVFAYVLSAPPASADDSEGYFLNQLYKTQQKWYQPFGEAYIIAVGRNVCAAWQADVPYSAEAESVAAEMRWTIPNTRTFIALSTFAFCAEQYEMRIPPEMRPAGLHR